MSRSTEQLDAYKKYYYKKYPVFYNGASLVNMIIISVFNVSAVLIFFGILFNKYNFNNLVVLALIIILLSYIIYNIKTSNQKNPQRIKRNFKFTQRAFRTNNQNSN
jgi:ammonia channel protein AmtB